MKKFLVVNLYKGLLIDNDNKIDQYGLVWNFTEPFFYAPWLGGFGGWLITDDYKPDLDTYENEDLFFSHRRSMQNGGLCTGRMISIIGFKQ